MQQRHNQAPAYISKYGSTDRVALTCTQSLVKYGNPYGDYANELLKALNVAWKIRKVIAGMLTLDPLLETQFHKELQEANRDYTELRAFLELHKLARPYQYDQFNGFSYIDLSNSNWEGHWSKK
jgi:hypothetical protein